jgi:hypothetical protein
MDKLPARFALAICDGPPGDTPGGRIGLLPALRNRLTPGGIVILDDYAREAEQALAARWVSETGADMTINGVEKPFAVLRMVDTTRGSLLPSANDRTVYSESAV